MIMDHEIAFSALTEDLQLESFEVAAKTLLEEMGVAKTRVTFDFERGEAKGDFRGRLADFQREVSKVPIMARPAEQKFSMGLELLWRRLQEARKLAGFTEEDIARYPDVTDSRCLRCAPGHETDCFGCSPDTCSAEDRAEIRSLTEELVVARNEMVERNLHLVFHLLHRYHHVSVPEEDLVQEANESLFRAVEGFDVSRGLRFKTYATYWVNQAFLNAIYNQSRTVRIPAYIQKAMKKIRTVAEKVEGGYYNVDAIADKAEVDRELVINTLNRNRFTLSLNTVVDSDQGSELVELMEGHDEAEAPEFGESDAMVHHLTGAMEQLSQREQDVVRMRFGLGGIDIRTLAEVGRKLGISLERVRQIQRVALEKMRGGESGKLLSEFG
ncbi:MAG: sigma-70 family RNA polymerase sigma factor [Planctomycetota bacterium]|nr:sigma-70 family RNA polymerase sigma factor [Planctomycetota bacterium]